MRVLVTGATGFIGSAIVRHLLAAKYEVRILARTKRNQFLLDGLDVDIVDGNVTSPAAVEAAMKGCSVVIDVASVYAFYPFWEKQAKALYRINVQGTKNMLQAAYQNRVKRYVHTSTIATIGKSGNGKPSTENIPFDFKRASHYARSKYLAEQEVIKYCQKGLPAIILNPAIVIGQRDHKPTPSGEIIVKFLNRSYPGYFDTTWSVADVDDVAKAHVTAISKGRIGERYILCNKEHQTMKKMFLSLEKVSGIKSPRICFPYPLLYIFIHIDEFIAVKIFKRKPLLPTEGVKYCKNSIVYNNFKALRELDYQETPFEKTLLKAVHWYRTNAFIEPPGYFRLKQNGSRFVRSLMRRLKIDKYADRLRWDTILFYAVVKLLPLLRVLGCKPGEDAWRRVTQSYLRTEETKFVLSVFRLDSWSDEKDRASRGLPETCRHVILRLQSFLRKQPMTHWQLGYTRFSGFRLRKTFVDIASVQFDDNGLMQKLEPYIDDQRGSEFLSHIPMGTQEEIIHSVIEQYNQTKELPDRKRPLVLKRRLLEWARSPGQNIEECQISHVEKFIERILSATFIHFEKLPSTKSFLGQRRFQDPSFIKRKHPGNGFMNICCRLSSDFKEADLWVQFSHIPTDGVVMQEMLMRLKGQWGQRGEVVYPQRQRKLMPEICSTPNGPCDIYHINDFVDFRPLKRLRKRFNQHYGEKIKDDITIVALLIWKMAHYKAFEDIKFVVTVDIESKIKGERSLGLIFIRPSIYFSRRRPDGGFLSFQREFEHQLQAARNHKGESYQLMENFTLVSPVMYAATMKMIPSGLREFSGTLGVTILKKADYFLSPFSDVQCDGFIAISNFLQDAEDGRKVGNVSIKGPKNRVNNYMEAIKEVASLKN